MDILTIIIVFFVMLEVMNVALLYFQPGSKRGNALGYFTSWEKSKKDPEIHTLMQYLVYWVAGTKLIFIGLLVVIVVVSNERTMMYAVGILIVSISSFYWKLYPLIKQMDRNNLLTVKGYAKKLGVMIGVFILVFLTSLLWRIIELNQEDLNAQESDGWELFDHMEELLSGVWVLSPAHEQIGTKSFEHKAVKPLVGTTQTGIEFKVIGGEVTLMEDLLPHTTKTMVTMYHCKDIACSTLKATHYCSKQNQPEFIANTKASSETKIVFDCDMSTELCQSDEDHIHQIVHEVSNEGKHLKTSYFSWKGGKLNSTHSIYHFDKK